MRLSGYAAALVVAATLACAPKFLPIKSEIETAFQTQGPITSNIRRNSYVEERNHSVYIEFKSEVNCNNTGCNYRYSIDNKGDPVRIEWISLDNSEFKDMGAKISRKLLKDTKFSAKSKSPPKVNHYPVRIYIKRQDGHDVYAASGMAPAYVPNVK